jgi:hypothetical protein
MASRGRTPRRHFDVYADTQLTSYAPSLGLTASARQVCSEDEDHILQLLFPPTAGPRSASARVRVASRQDLKGFVRVANTNKLIRVSDQDFWELRQSKEGGMELVRLVEDETES